MTPKIPYELARAREQREQAIKNYDAAVDNNLGQQTIQQLWDVYEAFEICCLYYYARWQELGGTSDIESLGFGRPSDKTNIGGGA